MSRFLRQGLAALFVSAACASSSTEKGELVQVDLSREQVAAAHAPRRIALVVGISHFDDPEWHPLRYPEKDAADLARVLQDRNRGAFDQVETISGGATRPAIREALHRLSEIDQDERDTVVVYLSSHGTLARDARGGLRRYLVTRDTRLRDIPGTALSMDDLKADFDALRSRRKVLILATCHSGTGKSLLPSEVQHELQGVKGGFFVRPIEEVSRASVVLAACDWGETAREDDRLANDIYTHYLVEALEIGADRNGDGAVTVSEAHDYARRMTYEFTGGQQRPTAESTEVGADPIILVGHVVRQGKPELYSYATSLDGFTLAVDGKPLADLPGGIALEPGRHRVQLSKGGGPPLADLPVSLSPGERVELGELLQRGEGMWEVGARFALLGFLDARSRRDVLAPVPGFGMTATLHGWPSPQLGLRLDLAFARGTARFVDQNASALYRYSAFTAGVSLPWRIPLSLPDGLALHAGPRLSAISIERGFHLALAPPGQSYLSVTPGLLLGGSWALGRGLEIGLETQLDWMLVRVDGQSRSSGFGELLLGVGYRW